MLKRLETVLAHTSDIGLLLICFLTLQISDEVNHKWWEYTKTGCSKCVLCCVLQP